VTPISRFRSQPPGNTGGQHDTLRLRASRSWNAIGPALP